MVSELILVLIKNTPNLNKLVVKMMQKPVEKT